MEDKLFSVTGQVVVASGASRGIGLALARGFAERGAKVIITGREQATLDAAVRETGHGAESFVCDVANDAHIGALCDHLRARHGHVDTLLNVAGINFRKKAETYTMEEFDRILDINLRGMFALSQAIGRMMIERRSGNLISIDSLNTYAPLKGVTPYAMSKGGVSLMTRGLATEWGEHGIRVNAIAPGFFPTALSAKLWAQDKMKAWGEGHTPLGRLGDVRELVGAAIFLASAAAGYVSGQILRVDGGISAGLLWPIDL